MSAPVDKDAAYVPTNNADAALAMYRQMAPPGAVEAFKAMSMEDKLELLFHSNMHLTGIVARLTGHGPVAAGGRSN